MASPSACAVVLGEEGFKKKQISLPSAWAAALGKEYLKKNQKSFSSVALGEENKIKNGVGQRRQVFPECQHGTLQSLPRVHDFWHSGKAPFSWED